MQAAFDSVLATATCGSSECVDVIYARCVQGLLFNSDNAQATGSSVNLGNPGCKLVVQGDGKVCVQ